MIELFELFVHENKISLLQSLCKYILYLKANNKNLIRIMMRIDIVKRIKVEIMVTKKE